MKKVKLIPKQWWNPFAWKKAKLSEKLLNWRLEQEDCNEEYIKMVNDNFWDLI